MRPQYRPYETEVSRQPRTASRPLIRSGAGPVAFIAWNNVTRFLPALVVVPATEWYEERGWLELIGATTALLVKTRPPPPQSTTGHHRPNERTITPTNTQKEQKQHNVGPKSTKARVGVAKCWTRLQDKNATQKTNPHHWHALRSTALSYALCYYRLLNLNYGNGNDHRRSRSRFNRTYTSALTICSWPALVSLRPETSVGLPEASMSYMTSLHPHFV